MRIERVVTENEFETVDKFHFSPEGFDREVSVGETISYGPRFDVNPERLQGRGLYISPTKSEAIKLLTFIFRYHTRRQRRKPVIAADEVVAEEDVVCANECGDGRFLDDEEFEAQQSRFLEELEENDAQP